MGKNSLEKKETVVKFTALFSILIFTAGSVLLHVFCVDGETGYMKSGGYAIYILCALCVAVGVAMLFALKEKSAAVDAFALVKKPFVVVATVVLSLALLAKGVSALIRVGTAAFALDRVFIAAVGILGIASSAVMAVTAALHRQETAPYKIGLLQIAPVLFYTVYLLSVFRSYPTLLSVPFQTVHVVTLVFSLLFMLYAAEGYAGIVSVKKFSAVSYLAFAFTFMLIVTNAALNLLDRSFAISDLADNALNAAFLVYACAISNQSK